MTQPNIQISQERTNRFRNTPYAFVFDSSRAFYCNAILFINSGVSNVYINDIFLFASGESLEIGGNQNEVDATIYKIAFRGAGANLLQMWIKEDAGNGQYNTYPANAFYTKDVDKRITDAKRNGHGAVKGHKDNKYNNKLRGDF